MPEPNIIAEKVKETLAALDLAGLIKTKSQATKAVIEGFGKLGKELQCRVSCHKSQYSEAEDPEWMYDMVWWQGDADNNMTSAPLVLECELNRPSNLHDDLDEDFQKLVLAKAGLRVWISTSPNDARAHIERCKRQIGLFNGTTPGDRYFFAVYDWTKKESLIEDYTAT